MRHTFRLSILVALSFQLYIVFAEAGKQDSVLTREQKEEIFSQQQIKVREMSASFFSLNEKIDAHIQTVVETIAKLEDSTESKSRISQVKRHLIEDLKTSIQTLNRTRATHMHEIAALSSIGENGTASGFIDDKIEARVNQVMLLAASLYENRKVEKYEYYVSGSDYGHEFGLDRRVSDEYRHNRRQTSRANLDRKHIEEQFDQEEKRLTGKIGHIKAEAVRAGLQEPRGEQAEELKHLEELREIIRHKRRELVMREQKVDTQPVQDLAQAMAIERELAKSVKELQSANIELRKKGLQLIPEIQRLEAQRAQLQKE